MTLSPEMKGRLQSLLSKKFLVWIVATVLVFMGKLDGQMWGIITGAYLGVEVGQKWIQGR